MEATPNLSSVRISRYDTPTRNQPRIDFSQWKYLTELDLDGTQLVWMPSLPVTLRKLNLSNNWTMARVEEIGPSNDFLEQQHDLEEFYCSRSTAMDLDIILTIIKSSIEANKLKVLHIGHRYDDEEFPSPYHSAVSVKDLSIADIQEPESKVAIILQNFPNLRRLNLSHTKVSGILVKEIMTRKVGPLEWLCLNSCSNVSYDAIEWARSMGTVVEYNSGDGKTKSYADTLVWR